MGRLRDRAPDIEGKFCDDLSPASIVPPRPKPPSTGRSQRVLGKAGVFFGRGSRRISKLSATRAPPTVESPKNTRFHFSTPRGSRSRVSRRYLGNGSNDKVSELRCSGEDTLDMPQTPVQTPLRGSGDGNIDGGGAMSPQTGFGVVKKGAASNDIIVRRARAGSVKLQLGFASPSPMKERQREPKVLCSDDGEVLSARCHEPEEVVSLLKRRLGPTVRIIDLDTSRLGCSAATLLARFLRADAETCFLIKLSLSKCSVGNLETKAIAKALGRQSTLTSLDLSHNRIGDSGCAAIGAMLVHNRTMQTINLAHNKVRAAGACALFDGLAVCSSLEELGFAHNSCGCVGAQRLSSAMLSPQCGLRSVDLQSNGIGTQGAASLALGFLVNNTIVKLNISHNAIGRQGAIALLRVVMHWKQWEQLQADDARRFHICETCCVEAEAVHEAKTLGFSLGCTCPASRIQRISTRPCDDKSKGSRIECIFDRFLGGYRSTQECSASVIPSSNPDARNAAQRWTNAPPYALPTPATGSFEFECCSAVEVVAALDLIRRAYIAEDADISGTPPRLAVFHHHRRLQLHASSSETPSSLLDGSEEVQLNSTASFSRESVGTIVRRTMAYWPIHPLHIRENIVTASDASRTEQRLSMKKSKCGAGSLIISFNAAEDKLEGSPPLLCCTMGGGAFAGLLNALLSFEDRVFSEGMLFSQSHNTEEKEIEANNNSDGRRKSGIVAETSRRQLQFLQMVAAQSYFTPQQASHCVEVFPYGSDARVQALRIIVSRIRSSCTSASVSVESLLKSRSPVPKMGRESGRSVHSRRICDLLDDQQIERLRNLVGDAFVDPLFGLSD